MNTTLKKLAVIAVSASILFSQNALAARMGGGKSAGMQRSMGAKRYSANQPANTAANNNRNQTQPGGNQASRGSGIGGAVAGAAAGAVGGYMLGRAMSDHDGSVKTDSSQVAKQEAPVSASGSSIPWGVIAILAMLLIIGLMIFRRKTQPQGNNPFINQPQGYNNNFEIPTLNKTNSNYRNQTASQPNAPVLTMPINVDDKMVDGVETQYFLRQAKGMFLHIQSMNTPENITEIEKYMTAELYAQLKESIGSNDYIADFSTLDCQLLESVLEDNNYVASVRFFGKVSEAPNAPVVDFNEIWHFVKPVAGDNARWKVAGIQPDSAVN